MYYNLYKQHAYTLSFVNSVRNYKPNLTRLKAPKFKIICLVARLTKQHPPIITGFILV